MTESRTMRAALAATALLAVLLCGSVVAPKAAYAASWSKWQAPKQATFYTDLYGSASGISLTKSRCVAVDMSRIVSKKKWKKLSSSKKRKYFYYGEKIQLQHMGKTGKKPVTLKVADCGSFGGAGAYYRITNGRAKTFVPRWFDIAGYKNAKKVGITWDEGVGLVRWRYAK